VLLPRRWRQQVFPKHCSLVSISVLGSNLGRKMVSSQVYRVFFSQHLEANSVTVPPPLARNTVWCCLRFAVKYNKERRERKIGRNSWILVTNCGYRGNHA
jgi:hypothetical protein